MSDLVERLRWARWPTKIEGGRSTAWTATGDLCTEAVAEIERLQDELATERAFLERHRADAIKNNAEILRLTAERDALRAALRDIDERRYLYLYADEPWQLSDLGNAYQCGSQAAHEACSDIARKLLPAPPGHGGRGEPYGSVSS